MHSESRLTIAVSFSSGHTWHLLCAKQPETVDEVWSIDTSLKNYVSLVQKHQFLRIKMVLTQSAPRGRSFSVYKLQIMAHKLYLLN